MASKLECNHTDQPGKKIPKVEGRRAHCDFPRFEFDQNGTALNHREKLPFLYHGHGKLESIEKQAWIC